MHMNLLKVVGEVLKFNDEERVKVMQVFEEGNRSAISNISTKIFKSLL